MINVTSADNNTQGEIIRIHEGSYFLSHSIFDKPVLNLMADFSSNVGFADCLIVSNDNGFDNLTSSMVDRPNFVDRDNNNYHLDKFFAGIDRCSYSPLLNLTDIDNDVVAWDDPSMSNVNGYYNAGADESYENDVIFKSNLE